MLCVVSSHQELSGDPQYAVIAPVCITLCTSVHSVHMGKKITSTTPQHNRKHNRAPCLTAPSAHASYKGYGFNNAKPPRAPHRNTMIDLVVLGCRVWSDSHGQGSGGTIYRGAYYGRNSADVGRAILSAMWDVRF
jgi:hypothetical protein